MTFERAAEWVVPAGHEVCLGAPDPTDRAAAAMVAAGDARGTARVVKSDPTDRVHKVLDELPVQYLPDPRDRARLPLTGEPLPADYRLVVQLEVDVDVDADELELSLPLSIREDYGQGQQRYVRTLTHRGVDELHSVPGHGVRGPEASTTNPEHEADLRELYRDELQQPAAPGEGRPLDELERWWLER